MSLWKARPVVVILCILVALSGCSQGGGGGGSGEKSSLPPEPRTTTAEDTVVSTIGLMVPADTIGELERTLTESGVASLPTGADCFYPVDLQISGPDGMMMLTEVVELFGAYMITPMRGGRMPPDPQDFPPDRFPRDGMFARNRTRGGMNGTFERNVTRAGMNNTFERNVTREGMRRAFGRNVTILIPLNATDDIEQAFTEANITVEIHDECYIPLVVQVEGEGGMVLLNRLIRPFGAFPVMQEDTRMRRPRSENRQRSQRRTR